MTHQSTSGSHSLSALACLAGMTFGSVSVVRASDVVAQAAFTVIGVVSLLGYIVLRPGAPDLMKVARQNQYDAGVLSRNSQKLLIAIATSLAGPDRKNWQVIMEDIDMHTGSLPADVKKDIREAGKIMAASNYVVEQFENHSSVGLWYYQEKDADMINQASTCLREISDKLKVSGNISPRILAGKANGDMLSKRKTT